MSDIKKINLNSVASEDFLTYASEVIKERAIPNIEDNLKPSQRRILFTMHKTKLHSDSKHKKSAATVGETLKIHPHGDSSIYDAMIRMGQDWKMRYPLIDIQGNAGNINGSPAAAMRYTEAKLSPFGDMLVQELSENCVDMTETYDGESLEPIVMPAAFPNILCNGNMGIAVGMSSSILPHNLKEAVDAIVAYIDNPNMTVDQLIKIMPGPDLPTGGVITNISKIKDIYETGSGTLEVQGKYYVEEKGKDIHIVFTEVPYMVEIENIIKQIKDLAAEGALDDVVNIQNNTGRAGLEIRIILKPRSNVNKNLQILFGKTSLKNSIRTGITVLENHRPVQSNIFGLISGYLRHRHIVISNIFYKKEEKATKRLNIVEGMLIAVGDLDRIIELIKSSASRAIAKAELIKQYSLNEEQANAILDMKLSQLTKVDSDDIAKEKIELIKNIEYYNKVMDTKSERDKLIKEALLDIKKKYGDARRTFLKNLETEEQTFSENNYTISLFENSEISIVESSKIMSAAKVRVGKKLFNKKPLQSIQFNNKSKLLMIDNEGKTLMIDGKKIYEGDSIYLYDFDNRIKNDIVYIAEVSETDLAKEYFTIITKDGLIKKTPMSEYNGFKSIVFGIKLKEKDSVIFAAPTNDDEFAFILGGNKLNKFELSSVRPTGRNTQGVKSAEFDSITAATCGGENDKFILYDKDGAGKIVLGKDFPLGTRAGKGQLINDGNIDILRLKKTEILLIGEDLKGYNLDINDIEIKQPKNANNKIYSGKLLKIGL